MALPVPFADGRGPKFGDVVAEPAHAIDAEIGKARKDSPKSRRFLGRFEALGRDCGFPGPPFPVFASRVGKLGLGHFQRLLAQGERLVGLLEGELNLLSSLRYGLDFSPLLNCRAG